MDKTRPLNETDLITMFGSECIDIRLQAASIVMGREIKPSEKNILEHLVGTMLPEERYSNLQIERAVERGVEKEVQTVFREKIW